MKLLKTILTQSQGSRKSNEFHLYANREKILSIISYKTCLEYNNFNSTLLDYLEIESNDSIEIHYEGNKFESRKSAMHALKKKKKIR